jgi:pimeloyl-ACP methyl ester carboxylesterase
LEDPALLVSDAAVRVESGAAGLAFVPTGAAGAERPKTTGLVFYCGARVPPEAYAYLARSCARAGYTAVLAAMPLNFAILAPSRALAAASSYPGVARWVIAGHSLGGAAAASFVAGASARGAVEKGRIAIAGLLLFASYPGGGADLSTKSLPVVTVSASRDPLASPARIAAAGLRLPAGSRYVEIAGGNHAQFGEYGPQGGDGVAEIPGTTQRKAAVDEALGLLDRIEPLAGQ